jgi:hypothetical protein
LNRPKGEREDGGRDDKTNASCADPSACTKTPFRAYARSSRQPRIPNLFPSRLIELVTFLISLPRESQRISFVWSNTYTVIL